MGIDRSFAEVFSDADGKESKLTCAHDSINSAGGSSGAAGPGGAGRIASHPNPKKLRGGLREIPCADTMFPAT